MFPASDAVLDQANAPASGMLWHDGGQPEALRQSQRDSFLDATNELHDRRQLLFAHFQKPGRSARRMRTSVELISVAAAHAQALIID
jgi:hypothetical protein